MMMRARWFKCAAHGGRIPRRLMVICIGISMLVGCGFQLRGDFVLLPMFAQVHLIGEARELREALAEALALHGARVVDAEFDPAADPADPATATANIRITLSEFAQHAISTDADGIATAYSLRYRVEYFIDDFLHRDRAQADSAPQSIAITRAYDYSPALQLQAESQARFLKTEMRREAALRILRRLTYRWH